jgi:hypothetical protein
MLVEYCQLSKTKSVLSTKVKKSLDAVPLVILLCCAAILIQSVITEEISLQIRHWIGLGMLPVLIFLFFWRHQVGVLSLGLTILFGTFGLLSFSPSISITTFGMNPGDVFIPLFYGQPIFLLWFTIHLVISGKYYFGIGTKKYWDKLLSEIKRPVPRENDVIG